MIRSKLKSTANAGLSTSIHAKLPMVVKIGIVGNDVSIHHVVGAYVCLRRDQPLLFQDIGITKKCEGCYARVSLYLSIYLSLALSCVCVCVLWVGVVCVRGGGEEMRAQCCSFFSFTVNTVLQFYLIPVGGSLVQNQFASFLSRYDRWYYRQQWLGVKAYCSVIPCIDIPSSITPAINSATMYVPYTL